ncbi:hypothetical protein PASE110613_10440 [Paenibacillus sediminis]|uniref:Aldolase n=1 Tax=Paenibacillus sediminis TaxID=664909 RepID=A0ABS4H4I2_9BACL|nr:hypothetical protein [Paenibacillus sediminis]MBP1937376.1 hypothetical protein [Paenibacillus sediminis]
MFSLLTQVGRQRIYFQVDSERLRDFIYRRYRVLREGALETVEADLQVKVYDLYGKAYNDDQSVVIQETDDSITFTRRDYMLTASLDYSQATIHTHDDFSLRHALLNLFSSWLIYHRKGLLVHSSCIVEHGKAWMFSGQSGAGKSTVAQLSLPRPILSDEATFVYIEDDGQVVIYDSPFRSEWEKPCELVSSPLAGIHFLIQSPDVYRVPLSKGDAFIQLLDKVFFWKPNHFETAKMISICKQVMQAVPAYHLYFQKNDTFWERIS